MASRIILAHFSRNSAFAVNRLISARPEQWLCPSELVSSSPIKVEFFNVYSFITLNDIWFVSVTFSFVYCSKFIFLEFWCFWELELNKH
jgi:hypothetical protein